MADDHIDKKVKTMRNGNVEDEIEVHDQAMKPSEIVDEAKSKVDPQEDFENGEEELEYSNEEEFEEEEAEEEDDGGLPQHMFLSLPYLPADGPRECPHIIDLSQQEVREAIRQDKYALSRLDIVATTTRRLLSRTSCA